WRRGSRHRYDRLVTVAGSTGRQRAGSVRGVAVADRGAAHIHRLLWRQVRRAAAARPPEAVLTGDAVRAADGAPGPVFCLIRNWNLPSRELAAILSRRTTHDSPASVLHPRSEDRPAAPPPPGEEARLRHLPGARPRGEPLLPLAAPALRERHRRLRQRRQTR